MWFSFGRSEGFPTQYPAHATSVGADILEAGFITAFLILLVTFYISIPSRAIKTVISKYSRITLILVIGFLLLLGNFGQEWEVGKIFSKTPYRVGTSQEIYADVGVKIGLRSVNVTLKGRIEPHGSPLQNETIDYNERFSWEWDQGRFGFGPFAGHLQQQFRAAQYGGTPLPILWVVDYFVIDGEGFRHGRFYRTAGWYSHIVLWTAFACWLLAIILFRSVVIYGGYLIGLTGVLQLLANLIWLVVQNPNPLVIPFEDGTITTKFGSSFWIVFINGILCVSIAIIIAVMDSVCDKTVYSYFDVDPLNGYDEVSYMTAEEGSVLRQKNVKHDIPLIPMNPENEDDEPEFIPIYKKRRTIIRRTPIVAPKVSRHNKPPRFKVMENV